MKHNVLAHLILAGILFVVNVVIFDGAGTWTALLGTSAQTVAVLLTAPENISAAEEQLRGVIPLIITFVINLVIYYIAAAIIIGLYVLITRDKSV